MPVKRNSQKNRSFFATITDGRLQILVKCDGEEKILFQCKAVATSANVEKFAQVIHWHALGNGIQSSSSCDFADEYGADQKQVDKLFQNAFMRALEMRYEYVHINDASIAVVK